MPAQIDRLEALRIAKPRLAIDLFEQALASGAITVVAEQDRGALRLCCRAFVAPGRIEA